MNTWWDNAQFIPAKEQVVWRAQPLFDGAEYVPEYDDERLTGQLKRVFDCMRDGNWRNLTEIEMKTGDNQASISAQLRNLRKERFGSYIVERRKRGDRKHGLFEYRVLPPIPKGQLRLAL